MRLALIRGFPSGHDGSDNRHVADIMHLVMQNRHTFEGLMYSQFVRDSHSCPSVTPRQRRLALEYHVRTLEITKRHVSDANEACSDGTITTTFTLALKEQVGDARFNTTGRSTGPSQGPLRSLRMLDIYGGWRTAADTPHISGLLRMTELRGGVENLESLGIGHQISK